MVVGIRVWTISQLCIHCIKFPRLVPPKIGKDQRKFHINEAANWSFLKEKCGSIWRKYGILLNVIVWRIWCFFGNSTMFLEISLYVVEETEMKG